MMKWMTLAIRNILRNKRRSLVTLLAIGVGFAAISLFRGYVSFSYYGLQTSAIRGEGLGHLTIYKAGWLEKGKLDPEQYMFSKTEIEKITKLVTDENEVILATPQINLSGIVTNGTTSTIFIAQGVIPEDDKTIKGAWGAFRPIKGETLNDKKTYGVEVAQDLAKFLNLAPGKDGVVMTPTLGGQMNAMDIQVSGVYDSGSDATNDKYMRFTYDFAQSLLDTKMAEKIVVLLDDTRKTEKMRNLLLTKLTSAGINCEIKTWNESVIVLFKGKRDVRYDVSLHILYRAGHRCHEHRQHYGYGSPGENKRDWNFAGAGVKEKGRFIALRHGGRFVGSFRQPHRGRAAHKRVGSYSRYLANIHPSGQLNSGAPDR